MINQNNRPKDVADLFLRFGGDPAAYLEFKPAVEATRGADPWVFVSALRAGLATTGSGQPEAASLSDRPAPTANARPVVPPRIEPVLSVQPQPVRPVRTIQAPPPVAQRPHVTPAAPMTLAVPVASMGRATSGIPPGTAGPRQLDMLFERLAGAVAPPVAAATGNSLLMQWRLQS